MKKTIAILLMLTMLLSISSVALAASKPSVRSKVNPVEAHPEEEVKFSITIRNVEDVFFKEIPLQENIEFSKPDIIQSIEFDDKCLNTLKMDVTIKGGTKEGYTTVKIPFVLTDGKKYEVKLTMRNYKNYAAKMDWHHILINKETNLPMIKLAMSDDFGLTNVCFVREWKDENGVDCREIYDIYSLDKKLDAVRFRTLDKVGAYSVQVNDGTKKRFNSKVLVHVLDTDKNGVVDTYYIDDPQETFPINIENAFSASESTNGI